MPSAPPPPFSLLVFVFAETRKRAKLGQSRAKLCVWWCLDGCLGVALVLWLHIFLLGSALLEEDDCPNTRNTSFPVYFAELDEWHCLKWGDQAKLSRQPHGDELLLDCNTTFIDAIGADFTAYRRKCPPCPKDPTFNDEVEGCFTYSGRSAICKAAVHIGAFPDTEGGSFIVAGRRPLATYEGCLYSGFHSSAYTPDPTSPSLADQWAFTIVNTDNTRAPYDSVTLVDWSKGGGGTLAEPWKAFTADVTMSVAGRNFTGSVPIGPGQRNNTPQIELNYCADAKVLADRPNACEHK